MSAWLQCMETRRAHGAALAAAKIHFSHRVVMHWHTAALHSKALRLGVAALHQR